MKMFYINKKRIIKIEKINVIIFLPFNGISYEKNNKYLVNSLFIMLFSIFSIINEKFKFSTFLDFQ